MTFCREGSGHHIYGTLAYATIQQRLNPPLPPRTGNGITTLAPLSSPSPGAGHPPSPSPSRGRGQRASAASMANAGARSLPTRGGGIPLSLTGRVLGISRNGGANRRQAHGDGDYLIAYYVVLIYSRPVRSTADAKSHPTSSSVQLIPRCSGRAIIAEGRRHVSTCIV